MSSATTRGDQIAQERRRLRRTMYRRRYEAQMLSAPPRIDPGFLASVQLATRMMQREIAQLREALSRQKADYENLRRRNEREKEQVISTASEAVILNLLPVVDNFERAIASQAIAQGPPSVREGLEMVLRQLTDVLAVEGAERIEALNCPFDPTIHDAVSTVETDTLPDHHVAQVLLSGYKFKDRVIRPAVVVVATAPAPPSGA